MQHLSATLGVLCFQKGLLHQASPEPWAGSIMEICQAAGCLKRFESLTDALWCLIVPRVACMPVAGGWQGNQSVCAVDDAGESRNYNEVLGTPYLPLCNAIAPRKLGESSAAVTVQARGRSCMLHPLKT